MLWVPRTGIKNHCFRWSKITSWSRLLTQKSKMWIINWRYLLPLCSWAIHNHSKQAAPVELSLLLVSFRIKHVCWMSRNEMCSLFSIDEKCLWERNGMTYCKKNAHYTANWAGSKNILFPKYIFPSILVFRCNKVYLEISWDR